MHNEKHSERTCAYQGVKNVNTLENFAHVLNEWPLSIFSHSDDVLLVFLKDKPSQSIKTYDDNFTLKNSGF